VYIAHTDGRRVLRVTAQGKVSVFVKTRFPWTPVSKDEEKEGAQEAEKELILVLEGKKAERGQARP
jgi:hypothetical protein